MALAHCTCLKFFFNAIAFLRLEFMGKPGPLRCQCEDVKHGELLQELHSRCYFLDADITGYRRLEADGDGAGAQWGRSKPLDSVPS